MKTETKVTLADLGVKLPEEKVFKKEDIVTPTQIGGMSTEATDISDIAEFVVKENPQEKFEADTMKLIDENIDRVKNDLLKNVINPLKDKVTAARLEAEADGLTSNGDMQVITPLETKVKSREREILDSIDLSAIEDNNRFTIDDEDLKELLEDDEDSSHENESEDTSEEEESEEEKAAEKVRQEGIFKNYQAQIKEKIKPISKDVNLKEFRVSTKPISITKALRGNSNTSANIAQWALPNTKRLISFSALGGEEIINLNPENFKNRMQAFRTAYSIMFNHLVDANKPLNMDVWLKTICGFDIDHLYFDFYKATFDKTNFLTYNCPACAHLELTEKDINDMVVYPNDEVKARFQRLLANGEDTTPSLLEAKIVPVSDDYAIAFRAPTVYGLIFETSALDEEFSEKYADILSILAYIDGVYLIDRESNTFVPIDTNPDPTNVTKTVRRKVVAYYSIIKLLNSDQYSIVGSEINKIAQTLEDNISYQIPAHDCTGTTKAGVKCTHHFEARPQTPLQLLFSRHRLATIGNY